MEKSLKEIILALNIINSNGMNEILIRSLVISKFN